MTGPSPLPLRIVESSEAALRLDAAREWLDAHGRRPISTASPFSATTAPGTAPSLARGRPEAILPVSRYPTKRRRR